MGKGLFLFDNCTEKNAIDIFEWKNCAVFLAEELSLIYEKF